MTTYAFAVLVILCAGLTAVSYDVVRLMMQPNYVAAYQVVPWIALGVLFQGVYLLTSIGLNITKHTAYYPVATAIAAATSIGSNLLLVPRFGMLGAAYANALAYFVLAAVAMSFSQRFYPISYERRRLTLIGLAGALAVLTAKLVTPRTLPALAGLLLRGSLVVLVFPAVLFVTGFFEPDERNALRTLLARFRRRATRPPPIEERTTEMAGEIVTTDAVAEDVEVRRP
jgi:O-antigen/teichoic acid export membrane protein